MITQHFNKENLHHAYLIEGNSSKIIPEILEFLKNIDFKINNNPDFYKINQDVIKIDDARNLKSLTSEKGITSGKKIFLLSVNSILLEAQNTLLKIFEEPAENTIFFIVIPNTENLLKTLVSRFYLIKTNNEQDLTEAENFIKMPLKDRMAFIKEFLVEEEDDVVKTESIRSKSLKFLNALEIVLQKNVQSRTLNIFEHILKAREYIAQPGSSIKMLLESVALVL